MDLFSWFLKTAKQPAALQEHAGTTTLASSEDNERQQASESQAVPTRRAKCTSKVYSVRVRAGFETEVSELQSQIYRERSYRARGRARQLHQ